MAILAGFMVPHPPMIIPEIGQGRQSQIQSTIDAYEEAARQIAALKPETIIITSPHSIMYADYFHISPGNKAEGSFSDFGAPEVSFEVEYDTKLVDKICQLSGQDFPAGTLGERDKRLDHGTMVPLWFIRKYYSDFKIVRIGLSGLSLTDHYCLGQIIAQAVNELDEKAVFVASGDLSHKLQTYGPYGFAKEGPEYDKRIMDVAARGAFGQMLEFDEDFCDKAAECGHRSFVIMAGAFDGFDVEAKALSHEDVTGVGYGICSFYPQGENEERCFLDKYLDKIAGNVSEKRSNEDPYVALARSSVESWVLKRKKLAIPDDLPKELYETRAGAFVSIHENDRLRGCIGTIAPFRDDLASEIISNAISACSRDPRFPPIVSEELPFLEISVDVLGEAEDIDSPEELDVKRYGVIVSCDSRRGLLLPDLDGVDSVEEQIRIAREKGGIREDEPYKLQRFEVVRHG